MQEILPSFFRRNTLKVAKELLGKVIEVNSCRARIIEVEAYKDDPASHAYHKTERSQIMFDTYGHVYVYLIYGMYNCINFTTEEVGKPGAVLIRAVQPLSGIGEMEKRRKTEKLQNLCSGPGKLCQALDINQKFNGTIIGKNIKIYDDNFNIKNIAESSRVGIKDALHLQWRFFIAENEFVSKR